MSIVLGNLTSAIAGILDYLLSLYFWILLIAALLSWVNPDPSNPIVRFLRAVTDPVLYRVRRLFPFVVVGGFDLSPIVVMLGIQFLQSFVVRSLYQLAGQIAGGVGGPGLV